MGIDSLPVELLLKIFEYVQGTDLASICQSCSALYCAIVEQDQLWKKKCAIELGTSTCQPFKSYMDQYKALYKHKWLRPSIWHGDKDVFGSLAVSTYNDRLGAFELCELIISPSGTAGPGGGATFRDIQSLESDTDSNTTAKGNRFTVSISSPIARIGRETDYDSERSLTIFDDSRKLFTMLVQVAAILPERIHPSMSIWPPRTLPAEHRARNLSGTGFRGHFTKNMTSCPDIFRIRRWVTYTHSPFNLVMGETVETYSRVFLEDTAIASSASSSSSSDTSESPSPSLSSSPNLSGSPSFCANLSGLWVAFLNHGYQVIRIRQLHSGRRLEAIKLTGDIQVPRGEYLFTTDSASTPLRDTECVVPDFIHQLNKPVIKVLWHVADMNFINSRYTKCYLAIYDPDSTLLAFDRDGLYVGHFYRTSYTDLIAQSRTL